MAWAVPLNPIVQVNRAGRLLGRRGIAALPQNELAIINNWRASHSFPLNTFQNDLRRKIHQLGADGIVGQRVKRLESIHAKFVANPTMRLIQMQDIGGCRGIMQSLSELTSLVSKYKSKSSRFAHTLKNEKDYISFPKPDGYRSYHLIYQYKGHGPTECYDNLHVEIQIRTQLQHAWATAVEMVGTITRQALKSNAGDADWRRFFLLTSAAFAALEGTTAVPQTPMDKDELTGEIVALYQKLRVFDTVSAYRTAVQLIGKEKNSAIFVLKLDYDQRMLQYTGFTRKQSQDAMRYASDQERAITPGTNVQVVMVSAGELSQLRRAYPNYFMDIGYFTDLLNQVLAGKYPSPTVIVQAVVTA